MKYLLPILFFFSASVSRAQVNLDSGLVAYYPLNSDFLDYSGNNYHGTPSGGILFTADKFNTPASAAQFDGVNDWIDIPSFPGISSNFTISLSFRTDTGTSQMMLSYSDTSGNNNEFRLAILQPTVPMTIPTQAPTQFDIPYSTVCSTNASAVGQWMQTVTYKQTWYCYNVAGQAISGGTKIYYSTSGGSFPGGYGTWSNVWPYIANCTNGRLRIGRWLPSDTRYYKGILDEIRIYDRRLNATEFAALCSPPNVVINQPFTALSHCVGSSFDLSYTATGIFNSNNIFYAQLSDATGSFASPLNIGSLTTTASGTIHCTIPLSVPTGSGYRVRVNASANNFSSIDNGSNISITQYPVLSASSNGPVCAGGTLNLLSGNSTPGTNFSWTGPSFSSSSSNPAITNAQTGATGDYIITATLNSCTSKDTVSVTILPLPATPSASSNTPVCPGTSITFSASSTTPGVTYNWTGPSFSSTLQTPSIATATTANAGTYSVTALLNGCSSAAAQTTVAITILTPTPTANNNGPVCAGSTLQLTATNIPGASYSWSGPAFSSTQQNPAIPAINPSYAGTYSVTANVNGCISLAGTTIVTVNPGPSVSIYPSPNDTICDGNALTLVSFGSNKGVSPQYKWYRNGAQVPGAGGGTFTTTTAANADVFKCVLTNLTDCNVPTDDTSNDIQVTVMPWLTPAVSVTSSPSTPLKPWQLVTFTAIPVNGGDKPAYQWKRNGHDVIGAVSNTWSANNLSHSDTVSIEMTSNYMCPQPAKALGNKIIINIMTGVDDMAGNYGLNIYPNPGSGAFTIRGALPSGPAKLEIFNAIGQVVYKEVFPIEASFITKMVNLQGRLANGNYLLKLSYGEKYSTAGLTIQQ